MAKDKNTDQLADNNIVNEGGPAEGSLTPGGGTGAGEIKTNTIADIVAKLGTLGPDDLNGFKASIDQIGKEADVMSGGEEGKNRASVKTKPSNASAKGVIKEDLVNMFKTESGDDALSEEFINNATTLFESAVTLRVADEVEQAEIALQEQHEETIAALQEQFTERMDSYLDYVAEQYIEKNAAAIDTGIRANLSEAFINDLRGVFESHQIDIPEGDVDTLASLSEELEQVKQELNSVIAENIELNEDRMNSLKADVLTSVMEDLSDTQKDKMITLAEDIDFESEDQFTSKMTSIRESFFKKDAGSDNGLILEEDGVVNEDTDNKPASESMKPYINAISRSIKR